MEGTFAALKEYDAQDLEAYGLQIKRDVLVYARDRLVWILMPGDKVNLREGKGVYKMEAHHYKIEGVNIYSLEPLSNEELYLFSQVLKRYRDYPKVLQGLKIMVGRENGQFYTVADIRNKRIYIDRTNVELMEIALVHELNHHLYIQYIKGTPLERELKKAYGHLSSLAIGTEGDPIWNVVDESRVFHLPWRIGHPYHGTEEMVVSALTSLMLQPNQVRSYQQDLDRKRYEAWEEVFQALRKRFPSLIAD
ncbi:MAG: hypothetical protein GXN92_03120 [Candidatus Micrarchaeota archaeon]|nr:hypothetical protein [Candidatus Micrarchaeota archaeon]